MMKEITVDEFLACLSRYGAGIHAEMLEFYREWYADRETFAEYFSSHGCAIFSHSYDRDDIRHFWLRIHQTGPDADWRAAADVLRSKVEEELNEYEDTAVHSFVFLADNGKFRPGPEEQLVRYSYARSGGSFPPHPAVRLLTPDDADLVRKACKPSLTADNDAEREEAEELVDFPFEMMGQPESLIGIFAEGELAGIAGIVCQPELELIRLQRVFVLPDYRRQGLGSALVRAALSLHPDSKWIFQVSDTNLPATALAGSMGFQPEGSIVRLLWD